MSSSKLIPLYPTYNDLLELDFADYPELFDFIHESSQPWRLTLWQWGKSFLEYTGRNKSVHTYDRFRNELEKFLLWAFLIKKIPIDEYRKSDILEYADFCWKPPVGWIGTSNQERYKLKNSYFHANQSWRPVQSSGTQKSVS